MGWKRPFVHDLLFSDFAPTRIDRGIVLVGRKAMQHVARADFVQQVPRVVRVERVLHRVQVVEIAEELVEPMDRRQELILVAQVVLAELPRRVAQFLQRRCDRRRLGGHADTGPRLPDRRQSRADR